MSERMSGMEEIAAEHEAKMRAKRDAKLQKEPVALIGFEEGDPNAGSVEVVADEAERMLALQEASKAIREDLANMIRDAEVEGKVDESNLKILKDILVNFSSNKLYKQSKAVYMTKRCLVWMPEETPPQSALHRFKDSLEKRIANYEDAEREATREYVFPLDAAHQVSVKVQGPLEQEPEMKIVIRGADTSIDLASFGAAGVRFVASKHDLAADQVERTIDIPFEKTKDGTFAKELFGILHELGHTHQKVIPEEQNKKVRVTFGLDKRTKDYEQRLAQRERNAWARALTYTRDLRSQGVDVLAPFGSQESAFESMSTALGTYEVSALKEFGDEVRGLFLKKDIPDKSVRIQEGSGER